MIATALAVAAGSALAQVPTPAATSPYAVIEGVALDSLHRDFLRGALITVDSTTTSAFTDSVGRFRIDSVPPGSRRVRVMHAILDTIGIALQTPLLELAAGQQFYVVVSVPSIQTVVSARCTEGERHVGPAALLGTVQFAESESPAEGSQVILEFIEIRISGKTLQSIPFRRTATVAANGRFKLCGLPDDLSGSLMAVNGGDSTTSIGVHLTSGIGIVGLELPDPVATASSAPGGAAPARVRTGTAVLTGRVLDPNGTGLPRARVSVSGDSAVTLSDAEGQFVLRDLRSGTRALSVRRLGFEPTELPVSLHARSPVDVTVSLKQYVPILDTVLVTARRDVELTRVGFTKRQKSGLGYYLTADEIARNSAYDLPGLLVTAPMLRRDYSGGRPVISGRDGCVNWWVDNVPWMGGGIEDFIRPSEVAAIEVYSLGFTPGEFRRAKGNCETVVIWTKLKVGR
ncbi:MAG TPA: carboxypeptidase regulatory-like domain-containing protein [Gemmatimonadaceae bacterium]|jgi:hypothetical protein